MVKAEYSLKDSAISVCEKAIYDHYLISNRIVRGGKWIKDNIIRFNISPNNMENISLFMIGVVIGSSLSFGLSFIQVKHSQ